jgi:formate hydrogenlyase subunit 3/multisubunit Na+/H+ antiporter MnhD subunit
MVLILMLLILAVTAGLCLIPTRRRAFAPGVTVLGGVAVLVLATRVALIASGGVAVVAIRNWLSCDSFGALILLLVSYVGLGTSIFSWGYMQRSAGAEEPGRMRPIAQGDGNEQMGLERTADREKDDTLSRCP